MLKVILLPHREERIFKGGVWIYNNEISSFEGTIENGSVVRVESSRGEFLCYGFLNLDSKIMIRILSTKEDEPIDRTFFQKRIHQAILHRKQLGVCECGRLIFSEADFLPGLVVDAYGDYLVVQITSLGMERIKDEIVKLLVSECHPKGIYERSDMKVRLKEGLSEQKGTLYGEVPQDTIIQENGIDIRVDLYEGQKTGYFLDQKLNRDCLKYYVKDRVVLDCFSHTGGFALHAAKYHAKKVVACDISQKAVEEIRQNAKRNHFDQIEAICTDVFDYLRREEIADVYDVIILDPPAFTKDKHSVKKAYAGYKEINVQAMKKIRSDGYLITCSCSQHMTLDLFVRMLKESAEDSKRKVQFLQLSGQAPDHPALLSQEEQFYLKFVVLRVL